MTRALESGEASMSAMITLVQEIDSEVQPGFLLYVPLYEKDVELNTIEDRYENIIGYIYSPFRFHDFVDGIFPEGIQGIDIEIYDGVKQTEESLLYSSFSDKEDFETRFAYTETLYIGGRPWTTRYSAGIDFGSQNPNRFIPYAMIATGILTSLLLYAIFFSLAYSRRRAEKLADNLTKDLKIYSKKLAEDKARDEAMLAAIGDGLVATDATGKIIFFNQAFTEILGFNEKEAKSKKLISLIKMTNEKGRSIAEKERPLTNALKNGERTTNKNKTFYYRKKNGQKIPVYISVSPITIDGKIVGAIEIFRDISRELDIDKAKTEFVSLASHQLRTPLSSIKWFCELLADGAKKDLTKKQKEYLHEITSNNDRMIELVNSLLNVSRLDLGTFTIKNKKINLKKTIESVIGEFKAQIEKSKAKLKFTANSEYKDYEGDEGLLRIVIQNLISNALKYSAGPSSKVEVILDKSTKGKKKGVLIQVSDNGLGIPKKDHDKIFSKLFRAENAKLTQAEGTGLGLYIVKSIIEHAGGKIWFESKKGKGTTFYIVLPEKKMKQRSGQTNITEGAN